MLASQPGMQVAGGAGAGLASQMAQEAGLGAGSQLVAGLAGGMAGARLAAPKRVVTGVNTGAADVQAGKAAGVDLMTSDVRQPSTFVGKVAQSSGERIPFAGTGGARQAQQVQRVDAVRNVLIDYGADDAAQASTAVMADLAGKRSAELSKYSAMKSDVIDRLSSAGAVPVARATQAIDDQIAQLQSLKSESVKPVVDVLTDWKTAIQGQDLKNIDLLRKQVGESFSSPELTAIRSTGEKALSAIYGPLKQDMGDFIKATGQRRDIDKWGVANKRLSELTGDMKLSTLKAVLQRGEGTPEVVERLLFSAKPSEVRALYSRLSQQGRAQAQSAILARAIGKAGGTDSINPDRFVNEVKKLGASTGVFFTGQDSARLEGLTRVLDMTRRAQVAAAAPPTGVQAVPFIGGAVLAEFLGGAGMATAAGGGLGLVARAYESKPVRDLLVKLPQTRKGSQEEAAIAKRIFAALAAQGEQE
jgi:hypothetical protein